tara:strand:+ start:10780 stop:11001 length:222 start_codon:yes stop_codon:yes gene_type:complete
MNDPKPDIMHANIRFSQEGNTLGTTDDYESIDLSLEWQLPEDDPFFVIKTDGWSFNDISELQDLVDRASNLLK